MFEEQPEVQLGQSDRSDSGMTGNVGLGRGPITVTSQPQQTRLSSNSKAWNYVELRTGINMNNTPIKQSF